MSRILQNKNNLITYTYNKGVHNGVDLIPSDYGLCYLLAHSDGFVEESKNDFDGENLNYGGYYGNYIKIKCSNGMRYLYAHMKKNTVTKKVGEQVKKGEVLGYMWKSGTSNGIHLHFEVFDSNNNKIDPTFYIDNDIFVETNKINIKKEIIGGSLYFINLNWVKGLQYPSGKIVTQIEDTIYQKWGYNYVKVNVDSNIGYMCKDFLKDYVEQVKPTEPPKEEVVEVPKIEQPVIDENKLSEEENKEDSPISQEEHKTSDGDTKTEEISTTKSFVDLVIEIIKKIIENLRTR